MISKSFEEIKAEALRLGFLSVGAVAAAPVEEQWAQNYRDWLKKGFHAEMHYLENHLEKRLNPLLLMPGVKTILSLAFPYQNIEEKPALKDCKFFAAYARGKDYHLVVKEKLQLLLDFMGTEGRVFVDTAPILERYWAVKAGLGSIGRNGLLRIPNYGNQVFLGEIFSMDEFSALPCNENIMHETCPPHCHACLDACPHQALIGNGTMNANHCISYLTIEHRGELPAWTSQPLHDCFYGCDRCLQVCPMGNFDEDKNENSPINQRSFWENISKETYQNIFKDTAVKRAKYEGLMRNIQKGADE